MSVMTREERLLPRSLTTTDDLGRKAARIREVERTHRERIAPMIEQWNREKAAAKRAERASQPATRADIQSQFRKRAASLERTEPTDTTEENR